MILDTTTDKIQAVLGGAVAANQVQCFSSWRDEGRTGIRKGKTAVNTNNATDVNVVPTPAESIQREVTFLSFYNADSGSVTLTVKHDDGTTERILWKGTLATAEFLSWTQGAGWQQFNATGTQIIA